MHDMITTLNSTMGTQQRHVCQMYNRYCNMLKRDAMDILIGHCIIALGSQFVGTKKQLITAAGGRTGMADTANGIAAPRMRCGNHFPPPR